VEISGIATGAAHGVLKVRGRTICRKIHFFAI
jgi:hypothetical protein